MSYNQPALLQRAMYLARKGQSQAAVKTLKTFIKQSPEDPRGWWGLANLTPDTQLKVQCLQKVLELAPQHSKARQMLQTLQQPVPLPATDWLAVDITPEDDLLHVSPQLKTGQTPTRQQSPGTNTLFDVGEAVRFSSESDSLPVEQTSTRLPQRSATPKTLSASQRSEQKNQSWMLVWAGLAAFVVAIAIGAVYLLFFTGPDLSQTVESDYVTLNYPDEWMHQIVPDAHNTIVMSTSELSPAGIDPWRVLTNTGGLQYDTENARYGMQYWTFYYEWGRMDRYNEFGVAAMNPTMNFQRLRSNKLAIAVFQAIPGSAARGATGSDYARGLSQWFKARLEIPEGTRGVFAREILIDSEDIMIDGHTGTFTAIQFQNETIGEDSFEALYLATVTVDDIDYVLVFNGVERGRSDWRETAFAMAESMELKRP